MPCSILTGGSDRRLAQCADDERHQAEAFNKRLAFLSAFGDQAWSYLFTGWELDEYDDREREKEDRKNAELKIRLEWKKGVGQRQDQVLEAALEQLKNTWPQPPRLRLRSWEGWWL
jgi:hypothetical protein